MEINTAKILQQYPSPYYTRQNLALLFGVNRRTLDSRLASLIKSEVLLPLKSGFYLYLPLYNQTPARTTLLEYLGSRLVTPSYLSLEYALFLYGFLAENVTTLTYVTLKKTRVFTSPLARFTYRNIQPGLFKNFKLVPSEKLSYNLATLPKAIFDLIYFTPLQNRREALQFLVTSRFNWEVLSKSDRTSLSLLLTSSGSPKLVQADSILKQQGLL